MDTEVVILILVFVFYILPIKYCLSSINKYYGEGGEGEGQNLTTVDILVTLIPVFNIFLVAKSFIMDNTDRNNDNSIESDFRRIAGNRRRARNNMPNYRQAPPPPPARPLNDLRLKHKKDKDKGEESGTIKFNF